MNEHSLNEVVNGGFPSEAASVGIRRAEEIIDQYERLEVSAHPLFAELRSQPVNLGTIWVLMANLRAGISRDFVVWVAQTIARIDDRRIGSLLAKQLNDELGNGDVTQIHSILLDRFVKGLEPWRPKASGERMLVPGRHLAKCGNELFLTATPYEAVGALMVGEIFAKKMDHCVGEEIRRQGAISEEALTWLTLHEQLEIDHADDSGELAALVPATAEALAAAWRGAVAQWQLLWDFLDGVQQASASSAKALGSRRNVGQT